MINLDKDVREEMYRQRRRQVLFMKIGLAAGLILLVFLVVFKRAKTYSGFVLDPTEFVSVRYNGFERAAQAELFVDREKLQTILDRAYSQYDKAIWPMKKTEDKESFRSLASQLELKLDKDRDLSNDDELHILAKLEGEDADRLRISLKYEEIPFTVEGLTEGIKVTKEDLFRDITVSADGISPMISLELLNGTNDDFLKTVDYEIKDPKEFYERGDQIKIAAVFDEKKAVDEGYDVEEGAAEMTYTVPGEVSYLTSETQLDEETLKKAIELGKECFTGANEYGLRIFTEAHLPYSWEGTNDYTFEWSNPEILSAYVEVMKPEYRGKSTKAFNYLELAYTVHISQADGVGCEAEAVVCFDHLKVDDNGKVDLNPESAQLFTASYLDRNIKNTIRGWFGDEYDLHKINLTDYGF